MRRRERLLLNNPKAVLMSVFVLTFILLSIIVLNTTMLEFEQEKSKAHATASNYSFHLKSSIDRALSSTHTVAALIKQGNGVVKNFEGVASGILPFYPGVVELAIAPHGIIQDVAPLKGNEKALGLNLLKLKTKNKKHFWPNKHNN